MKRLIGIVFALSFAVCLPALAFAQTKQPPRAPERQDRRVDRNDRQADRNDRQADRGPSVEDRVDRRVDRDDKRTDRLDRKDTRVDRRETVEKTDREARNVRQETLETRIARNEKLHSRIQTLLPSGMTLGTAANGFKTEGQFISALHASRNLGMPFSDLKAKMTGSNPMPLGQAIQSLRPTSNGASEAAKAEKQAAETMK
jgi:hypothetical protein